MSETQRPDETCEAYTRRRFRDPGGRSALHPGHRLYPCPTCGKPNRLTRADVSRHYQCDACADRDEGGGF
jgi:DNA-directed RNA polymerase subunit RPC12/RpoP